MQTATVTSTTTPVTTSTLTESQKLNVILTPAQERHIRFLQRMLRANTVNSPRYLLCNDAINKFYVDVINNTLAPM
jgi:hypothetical protein